MFERKERKSELRRRWSSEALWGQFGARHKRDSATILSAPRCCAFRSTSVLAAHPAPGAFSFARAAGAHRRRLDANASRSSSSMAHTDRYAFSASHGMGLTPTCLPTASCRVSRRGFPV